MPTTATVMTSIRQQIAAELSALTAIRHDLHAHPELSFTEKYTSSVVQRELATLGIQFKAGYAKGTGVVGYLPATTPEGNTLPSVGLRADMDALPIEEATGVPYSSCNRGIMHACGHDGHITILIGAARTLSRLAHRPRPVTFVFQPAEEGGAGGELMCQEGALKGEAGGGVGNPVGEMFGLHGWPTLQLGQVASRSGPLLASVDDFIVDVEGVGGHAAYPHLASDPVVAAAHIITAIQSIASRNVGPLESVVCSVCMLHAGTANNIIPASTRFQGTVRTLKPALRLLAKERFFAIAEATARAHGCTARINWHESYPVTHNDPQATGRFFDVARAALGPGRVINVEHATMGGEDFSYYGHHVPACFFFLGLRPENATTYPTLHQPDFDFNDDAIPAGVEMMCELAIRK
ncbi:MAG: amidohydrolase [Phycisphaerales bacterium]|nr:amidohydrolase [Phycisphaerales bacterium]